MEEVESKKEIIAQEKMNVTVSRLRQEKKKDKMYEDSYGREDGLEACEHLRYEVIKELARIGEMIRKNDTLSLAHLLLCRHNDLDYGLSAVGRSDEFLEVQKFDHESYCEGWIHSVEKVWGQVKDHS